jgi:hypothetical protein
MKATRKTYSIILLAFLCSISIVHGQNKFDLIGLKSAMSKQRVFRQGLQSCDSLPKNLDKEEYFTERLNCAYQHDAVFTILEAFLNYSDSTLLSIDEFHVFIDFSSNIGIIGFNNNMLAFAYEIEAICVDNKPRNYSEIVVDFERFVVLFNWVELKNKEFWTTAFDIFFNQAPSISIHDEFTKTILRSMKGFHFYFKNEEILCRSENWYQ